VLVFDSYVLIFCLALLLYFFFSSRRRHTRFKCEWSSDVCSSDLVELRVLPQPHLAGAGAGRGAAGGGPEARQPAHVRHGPAGGEIGRASCREGREAMVDAEAIRSNKESSSRRMTTGCQEGEQISK